MVNELERLARAAIETKTGRAYLDYGEIDISRPETILRLLAVVKAANVLRGLAHPPLPGAAKHAADLLDQAFLDLEKK